MSNPLNAVQAGIYTRLSGYSALTTVLGQDGDGYQKIYDHVPQGTDAPYVVIGDDTTVDFDNKTRNGWEFSITVHCWDFAAAGRKSVKTIMGHIYDALHKKEANVTVTGFSLVLLYCEDQRTFQETAIEGESDHYYHGVQRFRALITEA